MEINPITEIALSRIWQDRRYQREMRSTEGERVEVVYGGVWTHSDGPDFRDALIVVGRQLRRGSVELHRRASDWLRHGHNRNPRYDDVILHVVLDDDLSEPVTALSGSMIPTVVFGNFLHDPLEQLLSLSPTHDLGTLGQRVCLPTVSKQRTELVRETLRREGWQRLTDKQLRFRQEMEHLPPGEALYRGLLDALGYSRNREGMGSVAARVSLSTLESASTSDRWAATALLLGAAGFLPLSPSHADLAGISAGDRAAVEASFQRLAGLRTIDSLPAPAWVLNRVRPHNHPVRRLASLGSLVAAAAPGGLLDALLGLPCDGGISWRSWLETVTPPIGRSRCDQITANILAPFIAAYADATSNDALAEEVGMLWEELPGSADDAIAKSTLRQIVGEARFRITKAIENQGLHQIGRRGCAHLRCFECPIAMMAVQYEPDHALGRSPAAGFHQAGTDAGSADR